MMWPTREGRTPLWAYAEVNPPTPDFAALAEGSEISFMPLETVWPDGRADETRVIAWSARASYTQFRRGDILLPKVTPTFEARRTMVAERTTQLGLATSEVHVVRPHENTNVRWLSYVLRNDEFVHEGTASLFGVAGLRRISAQQVGDYAVPTTPPPAQRRIADFLDREIAEIDAMDAELDRLVETLDSRRGAAVDQHLLGHDRQVALAWATASINTGPFGTQVKQGDYQVGGVPLINPSHIRNGRVAPDERVAVGPLKAAELARHAMAEGDIVVARRGELGRCAVIRSSEEGFLCGTGSLRVIPNKDLLDADYAALVISSRGSRTQMLAYSVGATMDNLNEELLGRVRIPLPALPEQKRIVAELDEQTARIDSMIADAQRLKALLAERRTTLITDVVTGREEV